MKLTHYMLLFAAIITLAWGSLFFTILNQTSKLNRTLVGIQTVLNQDNAILRAQKKQPTTTDLNTKLIAVQTHIDCLFNLATQPNRNSAYIANAQTCTIASTTPSSSAPVSAPSSSPKFSSSPQSVPNSNNKQANPGNPQSKPGVIKQITNFLGL